MKRKKHDKVVKNIFIMAAVTEALCGRRYMKWLLKRMKHFPEVIQMEIWLQVRNRILPEDMHLSISKELAASPIVLYETKRIYDRLLRMPILPTRELMNRTSEIIKRESLKQSHYGRH